jgi:maltooligosyltrehalose trehalohydrolase
LKFSVWAPTAKSADVVIGSRRHALATDGHGYWQGEAELPLEQGYRYSMDGGPAFPDPRSRWQRDGVHGDSFQSGLTVEQDAGFRAVPLCDALLYELHVGTFTAEGTYRAAQAQLKYLQELGVTHVELLPVATFPGRRGWGYDGVDLFAPLPAYGTPTELAEFVRACHAHGIAVLLDVVYNHLGPDGNYLGQYGPYFTDHFKTNWGAAINYDGPYSDGVRRFVIDNALMWLRDYGFDGLRLDAVHAIFSFDAQPLLEQLAREVKRLEQTLGRQFVLIAESDLNDPKLVLPHTRGGYGLAAHWQDDFHHALHRYFTGETSGYYLDYHGLEDVAKALREGYVYQGQYSAHRQRRHGKPPRGLRADQIVVSAQNHDQIGNRAQGERLSMLLPVPKLKAIAALMLLSPFVPMLFQGEEWGARTPFLYFTDHQDAELGRLVTEGRTREFQSFKWQGEVPNPQDERTFLRSKLDWSELSAPPHAELLEWHRQLIRLRRASAPCALRSKPQVKFDASGDWLTYVQGTLMARFNFSQHAQKVPKPRGEWHLALASGMDANSDEQLPVGAIAIYRSAASP